MPIRQRVVAPTRQQPQRMRLTSNPASRNSRLARLQSQKRSQQPGPSLRASGGPASRKLSTSGSWIIKVITRGLHRPAIRSSLLRDRKLVLLVASAPFTKPRFNLHPFHDARLEGKHLDTSSLLPYPPSRSHLVLVQHISLYDSLQESS